jgi:hypothetical protein
MRTCVLLSIFLFKVAVPPVLVAFMSLIARRFGPTVGGLLMGLPWMTGPVVMFLSFGKDADFALRSCTGVALGTLSISAFILGYAAAARLAPWPLALASGVSAFAAMAWLIHDVALDLWQAGAAGVAGLIATFLLLPRPNGITPPLVLPWWDIPARMSATFALVAGIMLSVDVLGPQLSGIVASYPVILTVVGSFTHHQLGRDANLRVLRGISLSLIGFVLFFVTAGYGSPAFGFAPAFAMAALVSVSFSSLMILANGRNNRP